MCNITIYYKKEKKIFTSSLLPSFYIRLYAGSLILPTNNNCFALLFHHLFILEISFSHFQSYYISYYYKAKKIYLHDCSTSIATPQCCTPLPTFHTFTLPCPFPPSNTNNTQTNPLPYLITDQPQKLLLFSIPSLTLPNHH